MKEAAHFKILQFLQSALVSPGRIFFQAFFA
jgi:hypothetical protein